MYLPCRRSLTSPWRGVSLHSSRCWLGLIGPSSLCSSSGASTTTASRSCCWRLLSRRWDEWADAVADVVLLHAQGSCVVESEVDAIDVLGLGRTVHDVVETDIDEDFLQPVLGSLGLLLSSFSGLASYLARAASIDYPGGRPTVEEARGAFKMNIHVLLGVSVLGYALIDVELGLVDIINLIDEAIDPVALSFNDIGIAALIDLPAVVYEPGTPDVFAIGASSLHLLEVQVATVRKVEASRPLIGPLLANDRLGRHD